MAMSAGGLGGWSVSQGIEVILSRLSDGFCWDGSAWVNSRELLDSEHFSLPGDLADDRWRVTSALPGTNDLAEGIYRLDLHAYYHQFGVFSVASDDDAICRFRVDRTPPSRLDVTSPRDGGRQGSLNLARGVVEDDAGGSGIKSVTLRVRQGDLYWNGIGWGTESASLPATVNGNAWSLTNALPGREQLTLGAPCSLEATALDQADNRRMLTVTFTVDRDPPLLSITEPAAGEHLRELSTVRGYAVDSDGVVRLELALQRMRDQAWWSMLVQRWTPGTSLVVVTPSALGGWERTQGWPAGASLETGEYRLTATAVDSFGYRNTTVSTFQVDPAMPEPPLFDLSALFGNFEHTLDALAGTLPGVRASASSSGSRAAMSMQRSSDGQYWDGAKWTPQESLLQATVSGDRWTMAGLLPGINAPGSVGLHPGASAFGDFRAQGGTYTVRAYAMDSQGNRSSARTQTIQFDTTAPVIYWSMEDDQTAGMVARVTGGVEDPAGGTGIQEVRVSLQYFGIDTILYWDWVAGTYTQQFSPARCERAATLIGTEGLISWRAQLPSGQPSGRYLVTVRAFDRAGNSTREMRRYTVDNRNETPTTVVISQPSINAASYPATPWFRGVSHSLFRTRSVGVSLQRFFGGQLYYYDFVANAYAQGFNPPTMVAEATVESGPGTLDSWTLIPPALPPGHYRVIATATGLDGLESLPDAVALEIVDTAPPVIDINSPIASAEFDEAPWVTGTASDEQGLGKTYAGLMRYRLNTQVEYWNWAAQTWAPSWDDAQNRIQVADGAGEWSWQLPSSAPGHYAVLAIAEDVNGNNSGYASREFSIRDGTAPTVTILQPEAGRMVNSLRVIRGTARDALPASGVGRVDVRIARLREETPEYWDGSAWTQSPTFIRAGLDGEDWVVDHGPGTSDVVDGSIEITVSAYDQMPNRGDAILFVAMDRTPPVQFSMVNPATATTIYRLSGIRGLIADDANGSGPERVEAGLERQSDGQFWNGVAWTSVVVPLPCRLEGNQWNITTSLPSGQDLQPGVYLLHVQGYDRAGNRANLESGFTVQADAVAPSVGFLHLADQSHVQSLATLFGVAVDDVELESASLNLIRDRDGAQWDGTAWVSQVSVIYLGLSVSDGAWSYRSGPSGSGLEPGEYTLRVWGFDYGLNVGLQTVHVTAIAPEAEYHAPTPYLRAEDNPWTGSNWAWSYLETFEDGLLNTPGVSTSLPLSNNPGHPLGVLGPLGVPSTYVDSVDADDGAVDGSGSAGHSFHNPNQPAYVEFDFSAAELGGLPSHVGLVWTDGSDPIVFEAFDENGNSLGRLTGAHAGTSHMGATSDDRFYSVVYARGISRIRMQSGSEAGIEVDHLFYGRLGQNLAPATLGRIERGPDGKVSVRALGTPGRVHRLQASKDLAGWEDLGEILAGGDGSMEFTDEQATSLDRRFYRLIAR